jgi:hypothetical protein
LKYFKKLNTANETFWLRQIKLNKIKLNASIWLSNFLIHFFTISILLSLVIFICKRYGIDLLNQYILISISLFVPLLSSLIFSQKKFFNDEETCHWLDEKLCLFNQLGCAYKGISQWPQPMKQEKQLTRWHWKKILIPSTSATLFILLTIWMPVHKVAQAEIFVKEAPLNWQEAKDWLDALEESEIIEEEDLEEANEQLNKLFKSPSEEWFNHESLEAGDTLHNQLENTLKEMLNNLNDAQFSLDQLASHPNNMNELENEALAQEFKEALENLGKGMLPINNDLLKEMQNVDLKNLKKLDPKKLEELKKRLKECQGACKECVGEGMNEEMMMQMQVQLQAMKAGRGGINRGPGEAPMWLEDNPAHSLSKRHEKVNNENLENLSIGENIGQSTGEHDIDKNSYKEKMKSGSSKNKGKGGETVWRDNFLPAEKKILEKYFR